MIGILCLQMFQDEHFPALMQRFYVMRMRNELNLTQLVNTGFTLAQGNVFVNKSISNASENSIFEPMETDAVTTRGRLVGLFTTVE